MCVCVLLCQVQYQLKTPQLCAAVPSQTKLEVGVGVSLQPNPVDHGVGLSIRHASKWTLPLWDRLTLSQDGS